MRGECRWSPCGNYLFAALTSAAFLLFETHTWTHQKWDTGAGAVHDACWGAAGTAAVLLFVTKGSMQVRHSCTHASLPSRMTINSLPPARPSAVCCRGRLASRSHLREACGRVRTVKQVAGLQFAKPAPALDAHLLPLQLGEVQGGGPGGAITALSWDVASSHLAVALGGTLFVPLP
jgi:hypothetical protein